MARELILSLNKKTSSFGISKIDRKKLYGFKKRLYLDEKGKECSRANLEEETGIVFVSSDISSSYLDHKGNFIDKKELEAIAQKFMIESISVLQAYLPAILDGVAADLRLKVDEAYKCKLLENGGMNDGCN